MISLLKNIQPQNKSGFTIIELLIATLVFSTILLIATYGVIQIGRTYTKGYIGSLTQNTTRSIVDQISQAIQLSGPNSVSTGSSGNFLSVCIGPVRYTYILNKELGTPGNSHVMVRDQPATDPGCVPNVNFASSGAELLSTNERLVNFQVLPVGTCTTNTGCSWQINLSVLYGSDDVTIGTPPDNCSTIETGGDFCGLATTSTTVEQRS